MIFNFKYANAYQARFERSHYLCARLACTDNKYLLRKTLFRIFRTPIGHKPNTLKLYYGSFGILND